MNFLFLGIFSGFLRIYFLFKSIKINLKKLQKADLTRAGPRGCDVALWATWQRHAGPRGVSIYYIYFIIIYSI